MAFEFSQEFQTDGAGNVTDITYTTARVKASASELANAVIEIRGTTSDGRRLCVVSGGGSAWLNVADLEQV